MPIQSPYYRLSTLQVLSLVLLLLTGPVAIGAPAAPLSAANEDSYRWEGWSLLTDLPSEPVRSASEDNYPPFSIVAPDDHADGFSVELLRAVLAVMGREVQFATGARSALKQNLIEHRLQVLPVLARSSERETLFDFSVPYLKMPGIIVVRKGDNRIRELADLKDKKVLVMADDIAEDYIRRHQLTDTVVTTENLTDALKQLASGIGDAVITQKLVGQKLIEALSLDLWTVGPPLTDYEALCFAVRNGDKKLLSLLNEGLAQTIADGTVERLRQKWLVQIPAYYYPSQFLLIIVVVGATLLLAWGIGWLWQGSLRRMVRLRTVELSEANRQLAQEMIERRHAEEALRRYAAEMADLYDRAPVGYHSLDAEGVFVRINDTELAWLGYTREELLWRKRFQDLLSPESVVAFQRSFPDFKEHGWIKDLEFDMVRKDGSLLPVLLSTIVVRGDTGGYLMDRSTVYDITERRRAETALRQREAELREAQRLAQVGSWEWDPQTDTLLWSDERYRIAGIDPTLPPPTFQNLAQFYAPTSLARLTPLMHQALRTGEPYEDELETIHPDGTTGWVHIRGEARRNAQGAIVGLRGTVQDITERKRAETELLRHREHLELLVAERTAELRESDLSYRTVADFTSDWETWRGEDGRYRYVSPASAHITGYPASAFLEDASLLERIVYPDDREQVICHLREQRDHLTPMAMEFRIVRADGQMAWIEHICRPVYDDAGHYAGSRASNRDITERKRAEDALREADQRKDQFLAILGHELRNPLAPIRNAAELLHQGTALTPDQVRWAADLLGRQVSHITRLVDDLLDVSRITRGKVQLQRIPVDLAEIATRALEQTRPLLEEAHHRLHASFPAQPLTVEADPVRLAQVIGNLLTNTAKYTDPGGTVWLTVTEEAGQAVVQVRDTGIGIPPDLLPRVFEMFIQAEQGLDRARGGLGLGLTLAKSLVEMHGGHIEAQSSGRGQGSTFTVRLPLWRAPTPLPALAPSATTTSSARTVLVVDDNPDVAESFALLLEIWGHHVHVVYNGETAITACSQLRPEIVFLDIGLPGIDGYETARRLRQTEAGRAVYLVAVTGYGQEEDVAQATAAGFDAHLLKPVVPEALEACLSR
ncbi:polar amino acid transport system substrate-binding protein [Gammaproteobacteria bacterium]